MLSDRILRTRLVAALVAILCMAAAFESAAVSKRLARQSPDPYGVSAALVRFAAVKARIPSGIPLGYLTDLPPGDRATLAFLLAQYALAPSALIRLPSDRMPELTVGDLTDSQRAAELAAAHRLAVQEDLGYGVILFRRRAGR